MNNPFLERAVAMLGLLFAVAITTPAHATFDNVYFDSGARVSGAYGLAPDGFAYFVSQGDDDTSVLRRIAPDGTVEWETTFEGHSISGSNIVANESRVCFAVLQGENEGSTDLELVVLCVNKEDGAIVWRAGPVATALTTQRPFLRLSGVHEVAVLYRTGGDYSALRIARRGADGGEDPGTSITGNGYDEEVGPTASGGLLVYTTTPTATLTRIVNINTNTFGVPLDPSAFSLESSYNTMAPDGSVLLIGVQRIATIGSRTFAVKVSPTGAEVWRRVLREGEFIPFPVTFGNGAAFFSLARDATPGDDFADAQAPYASMALDYETGTVRWDVDVPAARHAYFTGIVSVHGDSLVLTNSMLNSKIRVQTRNTVDGTIRADTEYDCGARSCTKLYTEIDATGTLRIIGRNNTDGSHALFVRDFATHGPIDSVVVNFGLKGGWNVGTDGQGLTIDIDRNGNGGWTFFAPWFAMTNRAPDESQTTTVADLHWYTLQADVPEILTSNLPVTIYETIGGTFATAGSVTPTRVGEGTVAFLNCNEGSLAYSFDEGHNGGAQGVVGLTRLTPLTHPCTFVTPTGATPSEVPDRSLDGQGGFKMDFSGTWSQVGASGQGLEFAVLPGRVIAGAWFTFDGATANDDKRHHWFTFDGSLATATNATATVTIYQTIGGTFDSRPADSTTPVGTATIRFLNCRNAEMAYAFGAGAGAFANATGTIQLEHLGGCHEQ